ncbi:MAG: four helix bundle protein [Hyphomicrobium sp.]|jgi:four helix bundle protein
MSTPGIRSYRDLTVWQEAMTLAANIYGLTKSFPRDEVYGMTAQLRRSATSVPANIAEGYGREAVGSYVQFLKIARGSLREVETHLLLAQRVGLAAEPQVEPSLAQCDRVGKLLHGLIRSLQKDAVDD